ncbi:2-phosphoxylose phosphatase 1-like [Diadema setosum]|uniref:2-phosphoxylose phosphatase 1-like n=1 Tax=Diadema setosum TaxID=31175 RepID=UPI003B3A00F8
MTQQEAERWIQEKIKQEYCNPPDKRISGEEGKFRPGYELKAVYVVARHGDRTPMTEFVNIPNSTWHPQWNCDLREMSNTMWKSTMLRDFIQVMEEELESRRGDMAGVSPNFRTLPIGRSGRCSKSQLTPVGWLQHMRLGKFLRGAYGRTLVSQVELLTNVSTFRSTVNSRTQQSALAFMFGFLKTIGLRDTARIKSVPNVNFCPLDMCACPALERLVKAKEAQHSKIMRGNAGFMRAMHSIAETLYGSSKTALLPGINAVAEILATLVCHEKPYPCGSGGCVTSIQHAAYAKHIDEVLVAQSQVVDGMYEKLGRMFSEPFLTEMTKAMYRVSRGQSKPLFVFNSGHDITIRPLMDALGLAGPGWPSYAGRVVFEMWEQPSFKEHVVRVLAYGHDQTERVRFCRDKLDEDGLCPLDALLKFVETENMEHFYASSFQEACRQHPSTK